ncbi:hypothetical protein [Streptomyces sp. NPDC005322]|uniref:hypothetical protein n=1 Tax=unclassified Streptomyces TaxID=2593676 RepID=UPI0033BA726F
MTKKTRLRVARIAAGAVIAAGASLTAAGAASAVGIDVGVAGVNVSANADEEGLKAGVSVGKPDPTDDPTSIPNEPTDPPTDPTDPTDPPTIPTDPPTIPTDPPTIPTDPPTGDPTDPPTDEPTDPPTGDPTDPPTDEPTGQPTDGSTTAPGDNGDDDNGSGGGNDHTCTMDVSSTNCDDDNTGTDNVGSKPVQQGKPKEQLAETGAGDQTAFLLVGAATMIAGGIGFRFVPRLVNRNNVA